MIILLPIMASNGVLSILTGYQKNEITNSLDLLHKSWNAPSHPPILGDFECILPQSWGAGGAKVDCKQEVY